MARIFIVEYSDIVTVKEPPPPTIKYDPDDDGEGDGGYIYNLYGYLLFPTKIFSLLTDEKYPGTHFKKTLNKLHDLPKNIKIYDQSYHTNIINRNGKKYDKWVINAYLKTLSPSEFTKCFQYFSYLLKNILISINNEDTISDEMIKNNKSLFIYEGQGITEIKDLNHKKQINNQYF